jgi:beta-lactamase regulating signal transducer with metallopeptidase domain
MNYISTTTYNYNASGTLISATTDNSFLASTTPATYNGFTAGEIVLTLFIFWILCLLGFQFIVFKFLGIKIKSKKSI